MICCKYSSLAAAIAAVSASFLTIVDAIASGCTATASESLPQVLAIVHKSCFAIAALRFKRVAPRISRPLLNHNLLFFAIIIQRRVKKFADVHKSEW
jgi:hypothetical protein